MSAASLVVVGGGPRALGVLMRLAANAAEVAPGLGLRVHVVDPHPPGGGRIWRHAQSRLLWMNSLAEDVTIFTDASVTCDGPVDDGPSLAEWAVGEGRETLHQNGWFDREQPMRSTEFAPRAVQAEYLGWAWRRTLDRLPEGVEVVHHATSAVALDDLDDGRQRVTLADGSPLDADAVVLAQGYLAQRPSPTERVWQAAADGRGLTYVPTGHTADLDLSELRAGEPVLVRGMGLAFVDLFVLLGEGRGGRFTGTGDDLTYHPSGREPVLHVGSTRGVPYRAKLGYDVGAQGPVGLHHLRVDALPDVGTLDWDEHVRPLVEREITDLHYRRLFAAHPERTRGTWRDLERAIATEPPGSPTLLAAVERQVPDLADRLDLRLLDRPLGGRAWDSGEALEADVVAHVRADMARRADASRSSDRAVFDGLLSIYAVLATLARQGRISSADRVIRFEREFHGFFSYLASGPPPRRLAELLALHRAGVVRFLGPDVEVELAERGFVARSPAVPAPVRARALVEARLPRPDVTRVTDPVVRRLVASGELRAEGVHDPTTGRLVAGQLTSDEECRAVRADGSAHPDRFLVGPAVSGSVGSGGFVRPGFDGPALRQNDRLARLLLGRLARAGEDTTTLTKEHRHAS